MPYVRRYSRKSHWAYQRPPSKTKPDTSKISSLCARVIQDQKSALEVTTRQKYSYVWQRLSNFCATFNLPFFPSEDKIFFYLLVLSFSMFSRLFEFYLSGIHHIFKTNLSKIDCQTNPNLVRKIFKGCKNSFSKPVNRKYLLSLADLEKIEYRMLVFLWLHIVCINAFIGFIGFCCFTYIRTNHISEWSISLWQEEYHMLNLFWFLGLQKVF